jgi:RNA polymerase sigma-70 factor, ECF subfamily
METNAERVSNLLEKISAGDEQAFQALVTVAYTELRVIARSLTRGRNNGHTLQPTALVNEAYIRLVQGRVKWDSKAHFFGAAARAMRQVLVAHVRQKSAKKRCAIEVPITSFELAGGIEAASVDMRMLDDAMAVLASVDERLVRVVELRLFAGCTLQEVSELTGHSLATVKRDWAYARAWLYDYMNHSTEGMQDRSE